MAIITAAIIGGGAAIAGGVAGDVFNAQGVSQTNQTNEQIAQMNNTFNAQQAELNRQFQAEQSANAVSTRAADLRRADLNPLLAVGNPAMAMSGSTASSAGLPNVQNPNAAFSGLGSQVGGAVGSAAQVAQAQSSVDLQSAQKRNLDINTATKTAELPYAAPQAASAVENLQQQTDNLKRQWQNLGAEFDWKVENTANLMQNEEFAREAFPLIQQGRALDNLASRYGMPELATQAWFWNSPAAHATYATQQVGSAAGSIISPLTSGMRAVRALQGRTSQTSFYGPGGEARGGSVTTE